jgi:hypothetical protein
MSVDVTVCIYTCYKSNLVQFSSNFILEKVVKDSLAIHLSYRLTNFWDYIEVKYICTCVLQHAKSLSKSIMFKMKVAEQRETHIICPTHFFHKFNNVLTKQQEAVCRYSNFYIEQSAVIVWTYSSSNMMSKNLDFVYPVLK